MEEGFLCFFWKKVFYLLLFDPLWAKFHSYCIKFQWIFLKVCMLQTNISDDISDVDNMNIVQARIWTEYLLNADEYFLIHRFISFINYISTNKVTHEVYKFTQFQSKICMWSIVTMIQESCKMIYRRKGYNNCKLKRGTNTMCLKIKHIYGGSRPERDVWAS